MIPKITLSFVVFCLLPVLLLAQPVKYSTHYNTNGSSSDETYGIKGYMAQPIIAASSAPEFGTIRTGYLRFLKQFGATLHPDAVPPTETLPLNFELGQNYPNPFNPSTVIPFSIDHVGDAKLTFFNLLGQQVRVFEYPQISAGQYQLTWDGRSQSGLSVPSGEYFMRLEHDGRAQVRKLTLLK